MIYTAEEYAEELRIALLPGSAYEQQSDIVIAALRIAQRCMTPYVMSGAAASVARIELATSDEVDQAIRDALLGCRA